MYKATRTLNAICESSWAITEDALSIILRVAMRDNDPVEIVEARLGRKLDNTRTVTTRDGIATIPVNGPIFRYANLFTLISGGTTIDTLAQDLTQALADPAIKAIVLYFDTPGGQASGVNEFSNMIFAARGQKPIKGYVGNQAASGGYWMASACDEIIIDDTALLGSIGALQTYRLPNGSDKEITFVSSQSPRKRPDPTSEGGRSQIQTEIDSLADVFVAAVARNRDVSIDTVLETFGAGGMLLGQQAVDAGMADRLGSYESVLSELAASTQARPLITRSRGATHMPGDIEHEPTTSADTTALQAQIAEMKTLLANERTERIKTEASAYVETQVRDHRLLPAEATHYTTIYTQLAQDDLAAPLAAGSRVDLLRGALASRPQHTKTQDQLANDPKVLDLHGAEPTETAEAKAARKRELLAKSDTGRAVLNGTRK